MSLQQKRWATKPPVGTQLNWGHPLSQALHRAWIFNEGAGLSCTDLVFGDKATSQRLNADTHYNNGNAETEFEQGAGGQAFNTTRTSGFSSNPVTIAAGFRIGTPNGYLSSTPSGGGGYIYSCRDAGTDVSPSLGYDSSNLIFFASSNSLADGAKSASTLVANVNYDAAGTYTGGVGGTWQTYLSGLKDGTANSYNIAGAFGGTFTDSPEHLGYELSFGTPSDMFFRYVYIWKRTLSPAEILQVKQSPYSLLQPQVGRRYFVAPPATTPSRNRVIISSAAMPIAGLAWIINRRNKILRGEE